MSGRWQLERGARSRRDVLPFKAPDHLMLVTGALQALAQMEVETGCLADQKKKKNDPLNGTQMSDHPGRSILVRVPPPQLFHGIATGSDGRLGRVLPDLSIRSAGGSWCATRSDENWQRELDGALPSLRLVAGRHDSDLALTGNLQNPSAFHRR